MAGTNLNNLDPIFLKKAPNGTFWYVNGNGAWQQFTLGGGGDCCNGTITAEGNITIASTGGSVGVDAADQINAEAQNNVGIGSVNGTITVQSRLKATLQSTNNDTEVISGATSNVNIKGGDINITTEQIEKTIQINASTTDSVVSISADSDISINSVNGNINLINQSGSVNVTTSGFNLVSDGDIALSPLEGGYVTIDIADAVDSAFIFNGKTDLAVITGPAGGMMVYNSATGKMMFYNGVLAQWETINSAP